MSDKNPDVAKYLKTMHWIARQSIEAEEEYQDSRNCIQCKKNQRVEEDSNVPGWTVISFFEYMDSSRGRENYLYNYCTECLDEHYIQAFPPGKDARGIDI